MNAKIGFLVLVAIVSGIASWYGLSWVWKGIAIAGVVYLVMGVKE